MSNTTPVSPEKLDRTERLIRDFSKYLDDSEYKSLDEGEKALLDIFTAWLRRTGQLT